MQRPPHPTLLATIGLLGCEPRSETEAPITIEQQPEGEPSGRQGSIEPGTRTDESAGIPESREWCGAIIDTRPRPLLRTSSFLLAWNEIRTAGGRAPAGPIPLNEHDARLTICGSPTCEATVPRPIEFNDVAGRISIGTVVAIEGGELLAIPDISPYFGASQCPSATTVALQKVGDHLQLTGQAQPRRRYHHHGYYGYGYGGCYAQEGRHDVFVDVVTGMIELEIKHRSEQLGVTAVQGAGLQVTLTGCNDTLVLTWTE